MWQVEAAWLAADKGVTVVIASGKGGDSILQVVSGALSCRSVYL